MTGPAPAFARPRRRSALGLFSLLARHGPSPRRRRSARPGTASGPDPTSAPGVGPEIERIPDDGAAPAEMTVTDPGVVATVNRSDAADESPSMTVTAPDAPPGPGPLAPSVEAAPAVPGPWTRRVLPWLRGGAVVAVIGLLMMQVGHGPVVAALGSITVPVLAAALGLGLLTTVAAALRWCVVARGVGLDLSLGRATADVYRATFLNSVLPAGVLGDVHRAVVHGAESARGARAVVMERVAGQLVVVLAAVGVLLASPQLLGAAAGGLAGAAVVLAAVLGVLGVVGLVVAHARGPRIARIRAGAVSTAADLRNGLFTTRTWPAVVGLSIVAFGGLVALFVVAARTAGVTPDVASTAHLVPLLVLALLAMVIPIGVGGWGPREAMSTAAFGAVGLGAHLGLSVAVVYGVLSLVSCLPGLLVMLLARRPRAVLGGT